MQSPRALGFRMPAEWERHEATWIAWPHEATDWPGKFAPIAWVFSQSTNSAPFIGALYLIIWLIAVGFGLTLLSMPFRRNSRTDSNYIVLWKGIFILVALQMTTTLRPIVGTSPNWLSAERKFFLSYWMENMSDSPEARK